MDKKWQGGTNGFLSRDFGQGFLHWGSAAMLPPAPWQDHHPGSVGLQWWADWPQQEKGWEEARRKHVMSCSRGSSNPVMDSHEILPFKMLVFSGHFSEPSNILRPSLFSCFSLSYLLPSSFPCPLCNNYACLTHFRVVCVCTPEASVQLSQQ